MLKCVRRDDCYISSFSEITCCDFLQNLVHVFISISQSMTSILKCWIHLTWKCRIKAKSNVKSFSNLCRNLNEKHFEKKEPSSVASGFTFIIALVKCVHILSNALSEYAMKGYEFPRRDLHFISSQHWSSQGITYLPCFRANSRTVLGVFNIVL